MVTRSKTIQIRKRLSKGIVCFVLYVYLCVVRCKIPLRKAGQCGANGRGCGVVLIHVLVVASIKTQTGLTGLFDDLVFFFNKF